MTIRENYEQWLKDFAGDADTVRELEAIRNDEKEMEDRFYTELSFGTAGMRGVLGAGTNRMNKYNVRRATKGLAGYLLEKPEEAKRGVVIAYDSRRCSPEFAKDTALVLCAEGVPAFLFDALRPVPVLSYAVRHLHAIAGVVITASHNPPQYNGYKVYGEDGAQVGPEAAEGITRVIRATKYTDCVLMDEQEALSKGLLKIIGNKEVDDDYIAQIKTLSINPDLLRTEGSKLHIVYTPLHGCGVRLVPEILQRSGFKNIIHVPEQDISDGNFPTVISPNPEEPAALKLAIEKAEQTGADLVIGTDPDADRVGIAVRDEQGKIVLFNGNQTASMLTYYILTRWKELGKLDGKKYVVKTIVTTELITDICKSFGVPVYNVLTGFKYIAAVIKRKEAEGWEFICGGEESYGFNVGEFVRDKDAPVTCMMIAECAAWAASKGMTLYQLMQHIYKEFGYRKEGLVSLVRKGISGAQEIQAIMAGMRSNPPAELCGSAVTRVVDYLEPEKTGQPSSNVLQFFDEAGDVVSVRPSGTEPKIKFYFGAKGEDADAKIEQLKQQFT